MTSALLWGAPLPEPEDVVGWFGAMQAQDYEPAKWAVAMRTAATSNADLDRAVDEGRILRTHALRPTWHFVHPDDIGWIQALTGPRVHVLNGHYYRRNELDEALLARCELLIVGWLERDGDLTRAEIGQRLRVEGIEAAGERLAYLVMSAELNGLICNGKRSGATPTYALVSRRASGARVLDEDQALAELTYRYFRSHGPATVGDLRWWSSLTIAQIRLGIQLLGERLLTERHGDVELLRADGDAGELPRRPTVHLLQAYDEYTVAFSDTKDAIKPPGIAEDLSAPIVDGRGFYGAVVIDGLLAGWWRRVVGRRRIEVQVRPIRPLSRQENEVLANTAAAYGRFHDLPVSVTHHSDHSEAAP